MGFLKKLYLIICKLFNDGKYWIENYHGLIREIIPAFDWYDWEKPQKP